MRICPKCGIETASTANFCLNCGMAFVEEKPQSQDDLFRKELDEVKETIEQLKKTLAALQEKVENTESESEKEQLIKQIDECNKTIKTLLGQIDDQKNEIFTLTNQLEKERKKKKGGKWGWIFVWLSLVFAFSTIKFWDCYTWEKNRCNRLRDTITELQSKYDTLQMVCGELQGNYDTLRVKYPMIIKSVEIVYNTETLKLDSAHTIKQKPNPKKSHNKVLRISYEGYVDSEVNLLFKWYRNGDCYYSFSETQNIKTGNHVLDIYRRNGIMKDSWPDGSYRLEIWSNGAALAYKSFDKNSD